MNTNMAPSHPLFWMYFIFWKTLGGKMTIAARGKSASSIAGFPDED
jgi:hypothetical protein